MADRPLSLLTKGQRRALEDGAPVTASDLLRHYEDAYASRFRWTGGPEGMEPDFPERMLFRRGLIGTAEAFGSPQICGGSPGLLGLYGQPLNFMPAAPGGVIPEGWGAPHEGPTVWLPTIPSLEIEPFCAMMAHAWRAMRSNVRGLSQPVIIQGTAGAELNVKECTEAIDGWQPVIFTLDRQAVEPKAIDLGAKDHTESLIKVINDLDCEILARMGIKSAGTEKASGVTPEETLSITQELRLRLESDLEKRRRFCGQVQDLFPGLRCDPAPGLMPEKKDGEEDEEDGEDDGGSGLE